MTQKYISSKIVTAWEAEKDGEPLKDPAGQRKKRKVPTRPPSINQKAWQCE